MSDWRNTYTDIEIHAWMDNYGEKYAIEDYGSDAFDKMLSDGLVDGVLFTASNPNDRDDSHTHWVYEMQEWESWDDMVGDIEESLDMYQELAG